MSRFRWYRWLHGGIWMLLDGKWRHMPVQMLGMLDIAKRAGIPFEVYR